MAKIIKSGGFIDFYISKKKYESLKTEKGKMNYVYNILKQYLNNMVDTIEHGIEIRDMDIAPNNFWGNDIHIINSGYSNLKENKIKLIVRTFQIDLIGVILVKELKDIFPVFERGHFIVKFSHTKII